ncbi:AAA family ATPase [uncultured Phascolarctobacterium sp.]|uniref:AAA family ATPase n=1 Tax=uncultured Phascolarctobacterium sp. TaxID=512296 RepID=UPI0025DDEF40|nr:AAA family ATPase [uncultured Phascolarctobacterium sp.]
MGLFLNTLSPAMLYEEIAGSKYFVDKTEFISRVAERIGTSNKYLCLTRPRRFGKTVMANMLGAFFTKAGDSRGLFASLKVSKDKQTMQQLNQYNVIYIDFSRVGGDSSSYTSYIENIIAILKNDLHKAYPQIDYRLGGNVSEDLERITAATGERFIFIFDEWDAIFHTSFITEEDRKSYLLFLKDLLKDRAYVYLAYMTGVLPISKYTSGSELNTFAEYNMATMVMYSDVFGFTDIEVDALFAKYLQATDRPQVTREGLRVWYDGYHTAAGELMYNPRSVVLALQNNQLYNYWTSSGPYDEIFYYIKNNVQAVREDLALMIAGERISVRIQEYAAMLLELNTKQQIFSAMVVYGLLTYDDGQVFIPNKELMDKFSELLLTKESLGYVHQLALKSELMLQATVHGDTETMSSILAFAHNTETPLLSYNNETELSAIVNLVYLAARDRYYVQREDKAGLGYVDFIFYPYNQHDDCLILELKVDHTPEEAIAQIKQKQYALKFAGTMGDAHKRYDGRIIAVGIGYNKKDKKHRCKVEVLQA